jgi:hypothetical protein
MGKSQTLGETDTKSQRRSQTQKQMLNSGAGYNQGCNQVDIKSYQHTFTFVVLLTFLSHNV